MNNGFLSIFPINFIDYGIDLGLLQLRKANTYL